MKLRTTALAARRVQQTFTVFRNGHHVLWDLTRRSPELKFQTRSGLTMFAPNVPGARFPVYETHGDDVYRLGDLLAGLGDAPVVLDIGSHIGSFAIALAAASPGAVVHAYEASPSTAKWLSRNVKANGYTERVHVHAEAVSNHHGSLSIVDNGQASAHNGLTAPTGSGAVVQVPCVTFAEALHRAGGHIDLVKLDAEGSEYDIILSSNPAHWRTVQQVVMEYHPVAGRSLDAIADFLERTGIDLVRQEPILQGLGSAWFSRRPEQPA
jgi:FkbM family methyltransferase